MKYICAIGLTMMLAASAFAGGIKNGNDLIAAMYAKYAGKWYKTLTFEQKTTNFAPDGKAEVHTWYEAMKVPGCLRIDIAPTEQGDGILFADGKVFSFKGGVTMGGREFVHPLMVVGFDVYAQPVETTIEQVKKMGINLAIFHIEKWQGQSVYVVGAEKGDMRSPQLWVDKKRLIFTRLIQHSGKDRKSVSETQFNKYVKAGGGWVAAEVLFYVDGKQTTTEEYTRIKADAKLNNDLWDPEKWMSVDRNYWK
ncbi:MAG TPA: hypothetical protein PLR83_04385 [Pyrinomonadaceae bacterium]|nr:hypothetical protein [Pyrinomonadaceae bacterium]